MKNFFERWFEFVFVVFLRALAGAFFGGLVGFVFNFVHFVQARGGLANWPWPLLKWWALAGAIILILLTPKEQRPWNRHHS